MRSTEEVSSFQDD